jgi:hypothetical protein
MYFVFLSVQWEYQLFFLSAGDKTREQEEPEHISLPLYFLPHSPRDKLKYQ